MSGPRRFIAGARCPSCGAQDTVVIFSRDGRDYRACVDCGFEDERRFVAAVAEPATRATRDAQVAQPVRLIGEMPTRGRDKPENDN